MPELPQMQALAERLHEWLAGASLEGYEPLGFTALKTVAPSPESLVGAPVERVVRRGKYLVFEFATGTRIALHLSQAGRLDVELPPKHTKPKGAVVRLLFGGERAALVREYGTERKAGWWVLAPGDDGPMATLGPEATSDDFSQFLRSSTDRRRVHTILRDQHCVAGVGRGYSDDILHRARLSPYATLGGLTADERERLGGAVRSVLAEALDRERERVGGLSESRLGEHFTVHGKHGVPCPVCGVDLQRVSYESHEVVYCPGCQTKGSVLADRRRSRFVK